MDLESKLNRQVDGFVHLLGEQIEPSPESQGNSPKMSILGDWLIVKDPKWAVKAVARLHLPNKPSLPYQFRLFAEERLGVWIEIRPHAPEDVKGFLLGVAGNESKITFQAVGPSGVLPEKSINEYEIKGMKFDASNLSFEAWGLRNTITAKDSYFARLDGEPDVLAIGSFMNEELEEVQLIHMSNS
jgi:hypothetical protein